MSSMGTQGSKYECFGDIPPFSAHPNRTYCTSSDPDAREGAIASPLSESSSKVLERHILKKLTKELWWGQFLLQRILLLPPGDAFHNIMRHYIMSKCAKIGFQVLQLETTSSPEAICLECYRSFALLPFPWSIAGIIVHSGSKSPDWGDMENCSGHLKAPGISQ